MNAFELYATKFFNKEVVQGAFVEWQGSAHGLYGRVLIGQKRGLGWYVGLAKNPKCDAVLDAIGSCLASSYEPMKGLPKNHLRCAAVFLIAGRIPRIMVGNRMAADDKTAGGKGFGYLPFTDVFKSAFLAGFNAGWDVHDFRMGIMNSSIGGKVGGPWFDWAVKMCEETDGTVKPETVKQEFNWEQYWATKEHGEVVPCSILARHNTSIVEPGQITDTDEEIRKEMEALKREAKNAKRRESRKAKKQAA